MLIEKYENKCLVPQESLWDALDLPEKAHLVVSLAGGGGKTSVMYRLAEELAGRGKGVIVTTTTHIFCPADRQVVLSSRAEDVGRFLAERGDGHGNMQGGWILVAGQLSGSQEESKLIGLPLSEIRRLADCADVLLIEADGAKCLPIKVPREREPVIPKETDAVIGCAGLDCIGFPMEEKCFRLSLAKACLGQPGSHVMTPEDVAKILSSQWGTKKDVGDKAYRIVLNKADDEQRRENAMRVLEYMDDMEAGDKGAPSGKVVTSFLAGTGNSSCKESMDN